MGFPSDPSTAFSRARYQVTVRLPLDAQAISRSPTFQTRRLFLLISYARPRVGFRRFGLVFVRAGLALGHLSFAQRKRWRTFFAPVVILSTFLAFRQLMSFVSRVLF